jgi:hypothetical protein
MAELFGSLVNEIRNETRISTLYLPCRFVRDTLSVLCYRHVVDLRHESFVPSSSGSTDYWRWIVKVGVYWFVAENRIQDLLDTKQLISFIPLLNVLSYVTACRLIEFHMEFDVLTVVKMWMLVFWIVTPWGLVGGYQRCGGTCCLNLQSYYLPSSPHRNTKIAIEFHFHEVLGSAGLCVHSYIWLVSGAATRQLTYARQQLCTMRAQTVAVANC